MTYIVPTLGGILSQLNQHSWKSWAFTSDPQNMNSKSRFFVINTVLTELGKDDFTPLLAEQEGLEEFLLIHDILSVREYFKNIGFVGNSTAEQSFLQFNITLNEMPILLRLMCWVDVDLIATDTLGSNVDFRCIAWPPKNGRLLNGRNCSCSDALSR